MTLSDVYSIGKGLPIGWTLEKMEERLTFSRFPYKSKAVTGTAILALISFVLPGLLFVSFMPLIGYTLVFLGSIVAVALYVYPGHIFYSHRVGEYNEELLRAIMRLSTYVGMGTSIEYAVIETTSHLRGTLRLEFQDIADRLQRKESVTLGDAIQGFIPRWNDINPTFVKSFRLLQTAALSEPVQRQEILEETVETMLRNYSTLGKRYAEELSDNAKKLITIGILIPIMSLMVVPLVSIFLPDLARPNILIFVYNVFFPTLTLVMAMNFSAKRVQVDTVRIEEASSYRKMPSWLSLAAVGIAVLFAIPSIVFLVQVEPGSPTAENLYGVVMGWLIAFGFAAAFYLYSIIYVRRYKKLWTDVHEVEDDLPHLLQSFTTYLGLNISTENVIPEVIDDYRKFGFEDHPVVSAFTKIQHNLSATKKGLQELIEEDLPKLLPSKKVNDILSQILSFGQISQRTAARIAKMVRSQTMSLYKLDDYIKTLLADTVGLINITTTMLAPLLAAAAVVMSVAIVKSLVFITQQLELIAESFGATGLGFSLVDTSAIVPPVFIEVVVGVYLMQMIVILSYFSTQINVGNDQYKFWSILRSNLSGFLIYTILLFGGYFFIVELLFKAVLQT